MATFTENCHSPEKVNILKLKKIDSGRLAGVCTEVKHEKPASDAPRGLERPATTQPTCCPWYPPGSTLLECRLEGDQPVAHVVQVPADGNTATQKMSLLVETRQSPSGPYSRVLSRPVEYQQQPNRIVSTEQPKLQMAYRLESRECDGGPVAMITKVPVDECCNAVMTLEATKGDGQPDGPSSKIHYEPAIGDVLDASSCAEKSRNLPATMIECRASAKGTSAKITRCLRNDNLAKSGLETNVPTSCTDHKVAETRVDEKGPKTYVANLPQAIEKSRDSKKTKSTCESTKEPKRRRSETNNCSPAKCLTICPGSNKGIRPSARRNGLDPEDNLPISLFRRIPRKQVCPCSPSKGESGSSEHGQRKPSTKIFDCVLLPCSLTKKLQGGSKDCTESKTSPKTDVAIKKKPIEDICKDRTKTKSEEDCPKEVVPEIRSRELLTRFRDYFAPHQLQRYEVCRSRRNGLQDQCQLSIPRAVIELKKKEMLEQDFKKDEGSKPMILVCSDRKPEEKEHVEAKCT
ncbi:uncharacterized protein LOC105663011 [Megachile rotundata]|uniref:uncharacterized protein LOC105663011 n=1 Tax=Megachile rotundata TaxID=143995 RepID=UPI003FCEF499